MLQMGALFAVAALKHGKDNTFSDPVTRKTFVTWTINPLITLGVSYLLSLALLR